MRLSLSPPFFAYSASAIFRTAPDSTMDALAECRPQVESLVARVLRRAKEDPDVQDCTNEALRRAFEQRDQLRAASELLPWALGVARHVALDALRSEYRRRARAMPSESRNGEDLVGQLPSREPSPEALLAERQSLRHLDAALRALPPGQKDALILLHVEGLGYREIAERLGVPIGTVGTWVLRGRETLGQALGRNGAADAVGRSGAANAVGRSGAADAVGRSGAADAREGRASERKEKT